MAGAARKAKLSTYTVTVRREVEQVLTFEVEARSTEEAQDVAAASASAYDANQWVQSIICQSAKAKVKR